MVSKRCLLDCLAPVLALLALAVSADGVDFDCSHFAVDGRPFTLQCPTTCSLQTHTVEWCFMNGLASVAFDRHTYTVCLNASQVTGAYQPENIPDAIQLENIEVRAAGELFLPVVLYDTFGEAYFNCSVIDEEGSVCSVEAFTLSVHVPRPYQPPELNEPVASELIVGRAATICGSGRFPTKDGLMIWRKEKGGGNVEPVDISNNITCSDCECATNAVLEMMGLQPGGYYGANDRTMAFSALYNDYQTPIVQKCADPNRLMSVLVISSVELEDAGSYDFRYVADHLYTKTIELETAYAKVAPVFDDDRSKHELVQAEHSNAIFICHANTSYNAYLQWTHLAEDVFAIPIIDNVTVVDPLMITDSSTSLDGFCSSRSGQRMSVTLEQTPVPRVPDRATVLRQQSALIFCGIRHEHAGTYICTASDYPDQLDGTSVDVRLVTDGASSNDDIAVIAGSAVISGVVLLLAAGICLLCGYKYKNKSHVQRMVPMEPCTVTNPTFFEMLASASILSEGALEFPRDRLRLIEVVGEGQFGQVWKAEAQGICHDQNRSIVAVKTLKPTARPSDVDDLYKELEMMKRMQPHPNILNFLGQCSETDVESLYILMEFAIHGSLKHYLQTCKAAMLASMDGTTLSHCPPLNPLLSSVAPVCSRHFLQATLSPTSTASLLPAVDTGSDVRSPPADIDPAIAVHAARLLRLLQNECFYRNRYLDSADEGEAALPYLKPVPSGRASRAAEPTQILPTEHTSEDKGEQPTEYTFDKLAPKGGAQASYVFDHLSPQEESSSTVANRSLVRASDVSTPQDDSSVASSAAAAKGDQSPCDAPTTSKPNPIGAASSIRPPLAFSTLAPLLVEGQCAYRPCIDDPYQYYPQSHYSAYYNQECVEGSEHGNPFSPAPTLSPTYTNVPDVTDGVNPRSPPDVYAALTECVYCECGGRQGEAETSTRVDGDRREKKRYSGLGGQCVLTQAEILDFSLQIARGMEHLEKMKCVHRDLAARNVLIAENFLLKIGDFGLARDLSEKIYYRKITPGKLPARWMAIESLQERTHTCKSDVWSYGVLLWEIFTYGLTPYGKCPYANGIESLAIYLSQGNRLSQPEDCSDEMYNLMLQCWNADPDTRPSFTELIGTLDNLLSEAHGYLKIDSSNATPLQLEDQQQPNRLGTALGPPRSPTTLSGSFQIEDWGQEPYSGGCQTLDGLNAAVSRSSLQQDKSKPSGVTDETESQPDRHTAATSQSLHAPNGRLSKSPSGSNVEAMPSISGQSSDEGNAAGAHSNGRPPTSVSPRSSPGVATLSHSQHKATSAEASNGLLLPVMHEVSRVEITNMGVDSIPRSPLSRALQLNSCSRESQV